MSQRYGEIEQALERMIQAVRAHLEAVAAAAGASDDEGVWRAYIALNNAAHEYDELLGEVYGEVTPFDIEPITGEGEEGVRPGLVSMPPEVTAVDPYPHVVSVRQRRDYRVRSVAALLRVAELSRPAPPEGESYEPIRTVGDAVIELLQSGDGSLGMLDLPELDPLDGVVVVADVATALPADSLRDVAEAESDRPFRLDAGATVLARLHESTPVSGDADLT